jgi:SAM-dependent methyltransferase
MIKLYQSAWHDINFKSFTECSDKKIADKVFYDKYYEQFFDKFKGFEDLDKDWVKYKILIANKLIKEIQSKKNILSIGCGIGIVEKHIVENVKDINITAIEPSENTSKWIKGISQIKVKDGYFPGILDVDLSFDMSFSNTVDYVFNDKEYEIFLKSIVDYGIKDFILISSSKYKPSLKISIKNLIKNILSYVGLYDRHQFWGYCRTLNEQTIMLKKSGFNVTSVIYESDDTIIIRALV